MMAWTSLAMMPAAARECSPATAAPNATTAEISSILSNTQNFYQLNAIIFSAEQNGMPILRTALGISTDGLPARTDMHFRIGAVGWQYLTTLLLKMVDQQGIALRDPVSRWFRSYPNADRATVRMLAASSMPTVRRLHAHCVERGLWRLRLWTGVFRGNHRGSLSQVDRRRTDRAQPPALSKPAIQRSRAGLAVFAHRFRRARRDSGNGG